MFEPGDRLLYALSYHREVSWARFRSALDTLLLESGSADEERDSESVHRRQAPKMLQWLGHWDIQSNRHRPVIYVPSAQLARLPSPGLPRFVLCGARSPRTLDALRDKTLSGALQVSWSSQSSRYLFAPSRVVIEAASYDQLQPLAEETGIAVQNTPSAWLLAAASGSLEEYLKELRWGTEPEINWERSDFDPRQLRFAPLREIDADLRLSRYEGMSGHQTLYYLWKGSQRARLEEPTWARFAVLQHRECNVLTYRQNSNQLEVPTYTPLPQLLSRALTLCSGLVPRSRWESNDRAVTIFDSIPRDVADTVAAKVGQHLIVSSS